MGASESAQHYRFKVDGMSNANIIFGSMNVNEKNKKKLERKSK